MARKRKGWVEETAKRSVVRDVLGQFAAGTAPGPGRPRRRREVSDQILADLRVGPSPAELELIALVMADRPHSLKWIRQHFSPGILGRCERLALMSELAERVTYARLLNAAIESGIMPTSREVAAAGGFACDVAPVARPTPAEAALEPPAAGADSAV